MKTLSEWKIWQKGPEMVTTKIDRRLTGLWRFNSDTILCVQILSVTSYKVTGKPTTCRVRMVEKPDVEMDANWEDIFEVA